MLSKSMAGLLFLVVHAACQLVARAELAASFNLTAARSYANVASMTYCEDNQQMLTWTCVACRDSGISLVPGKIQIIDGSLEHSARIVVGKLADEPGCVVAFRGSDNWQNWVQDLEFWKTKPSDFDGCEGCRIHAGFFDVWRDLATQVLKKLTRVGCPPGGPEAVLDLTGHSLGAAVSQIAIFDLADAGYHVRRVFTFESPRVGDISFANEFDRRFAQLPIFRITYDHDPVVHLPPEVLGYRHTQTEVFFNASNVSTVCGEREDPSCSGRYWNVPEMMLLHKAEHCGSPLLPNHDMCNPLGCLLSPEEFVV